MTCRPRSDLYSNLPALRKLDNMLLVRLPTLIAWLITYSSVTILNFRLLLQEILDSFETTEFWYVDQGILAPEADGSSSFRKPLPRQEEKWWLPVPRVPSSGLSENTRKQLQHKRDCTNQILKASMAINSITLAEMEVPESFLEGLPKVKIYTGKECNQIGRTCLLICFPSIYCRMEELAWVILFIDILHLINFRPSVC